MKILKRMLALTTMATIIATLSTSISAATNSQNFTPVKKQEFVLVEESTNIVNGFTITDRCYYSTDNFGRTSISSTASEASGSRTVKYERDIIQKNTFLYTMYVSGDFTWNSANDTATVTNVQTGNKKYNSSAYPKVKTEIISYASNQGQTAFFGYKYAYAKYTLTLKNGLTWVEDYVAYIDVNVIGISTHN